MSEGYSTQASTLKDVSHDGASISRCGHVFDPGHSRCLVDRPPFWRCSGDLFRRESVGLKLDQEFAESLELRKVGRKLGSGILEGYSSFSRNTFHFREIPREYLREALFQESAHRAASRTQHRSCQEPHIELRIYRFYSYLFN